MKWIVYSTLALMATLLAACNSTTFKISAEIQSLGNQNIHIVFMGEDGVTDAFIPAQDGKFKIKGKCHGTTVVGILDTQNRPLLRIAVSGGETVEVKGDAGNPHHYRCKGSDVAQEWMDFEREHASLYDVADRGPLDRAIEKYVKEHPSSVVSTLLLVVDYSDSDKAATLLKGVDPKARPASLCQSIEQLLAVQDKATVQVNTMMLCATSGDFEPFQPTQAGATIIYWWNENHAERRHDISSLKQLQQQWGSRLTIVDVALCPDTVSWRPLVRGDSTQWKHYWAPGSILDPAVEPLHLRRLPVCIIADSTGHQLYRGIDFKVISSTLSTYFK